MNPPEAGSIQAWASRINWKQRVKAVCKPCWEIKYCPYGPLVEQFPLPSEGDDRACRIYGHVCPVFIVAEPFTETKELRNISRNIPRSVQFRVLKRDNQICGLCGNSVLDADVHFDHIIPWSKGGASEESNIRLLCSRCNRKRGDQFEQTLLVESFVDHVVEPIDAGFVGFLLWIAAACHDWHEEHWSWPDAMQLNSLTEADGDIRAEVRLVQMLHDMEMFFEAAVPKELDPTLFAALRIRWGFEDHVVYRIPEVVRELGVDRNGYLEAEVHFLRRLGWQVKHAGRDKAKWLKT